MGTQWKHVSNLRTTPIEDMHYLKTGPQEMGIIYILLKNNHLAYYKNNIE